MIGQLLNDLATVIGISGAFVIIEQMLDKSEKQRIAEWLRRALERPGVIPAGRTPTRITGAILNTLMQPSLRVVSRVILMGLGAICIVGAVAYVASDTWADRLHLSLQKQGQTLVIALGLLATLLTLVSIFLVGPLVLPILRHARKRMAFLAFALCAISLSLVAAAVFRVLLVAPATLMAALRNPSIIPLTLTVDPISTDQNVFSRTVRVHLTRQMSEAEKEFINTLFISKATSARPVPENSTIHFFNNDVALLAQAGNVAALFYTHTDDRVAEQVCGRSAGSLARDILEISLVNIHTVGADIVSCSATESRTYSVVVAVYARDIIEFSLGLGLAFGTSSRGIREMATEGVRDGIGISSEWHFTRYLVKDAASAEKMKLLREYFDRRQFESSLANVSSTSGLMSPFYPIHFWLPLMAVAIFASCVTLTAISKAKRRFDVSWLARKVDRYPLSVIGVLSMIIGAALALLRAVVGIWV